MDWLLSVQSAPNDPDLRKLFEAWLASDPLHPDAWNRAQRAWNIIGDVPPVHFTEPAERRTRSKQRPFLVASTSTASRLRPGALTRHWKAVAGTAIAASLAVVLAPSLSLWLRADYVTSTAEVRSVTLEDGTLVQLGPRSAIRARYTTGRREVALLAGEAWFDVAHNPDRPFIVSAGGIYARDVGTNFDVRFDTSTTMVVVAQGRVAVTAESTQAAGLVNASLGPGDQIVVNPETGAVGHSRIALGDIALWRSGRLFVKNATVADVVEQLRAYQSGWILIANDALGRRRVTGTYDLRHPDAALQALVEASGGRVRRITPLLYLLSES